MTAEDLREMIEAAKRVEQDATTAERDDAVERFAIQWNPEACIAVAEIALRAIEGQRP